jgi:hypothetical protein
MADTREAEEEVTPTRVETATLILLTLTFLEEPEETALPSLQTLP